MDEHRTERRAGSLARPRRPRRGARILRASVVSATLSGPFRVRAAETPHASPPLRQEAETDWRDPLPIILRLCRDCESDVAVRDALTLWDLWKTSQGLSG